MRKITSLLMLFFAFVGMAFAQITDLTQLSNDKTYFIESARCFLTYSTVHTSDLASSNGTTVLAGEKVKNPAENPNQQFKILNEGGSYYLYSVAAGKYVNKSGKYVDTATDAMEITKVGGNYPWKILIGGNGLNSQDPGQTEPGVVVNSWTDTDPGNCFKITPAEDVLVPITSVGQLSNSKLYTVAPKAANARGVLYATSTSTCLDACGGTSGNNHSVAVNPKSADQQFAFYTHEGNTYLYAVGAGKFVGGITNDRYFSLVDTPSSAFTVTESSQSGYFIVKLDNSNYINVSIGWTHGCVGAWATEDDGNRLVITPVADMSSELSTTLFNAFNTQREFTYTFKYNGEVKATQTCSGNVGAEYPEVDATKLPFGVIATKPAGTIPADVASNIDVDLTIDLPFETAADYNSVTKWYYLKFHADSKHPLYYPGDESVLLTDKTAVDATNKDAYTWAFIGNPFDGFKVVNKAAGADKALVASANGAIVSTGTDNVFKFTTSTHATNGFYIQCTTGDYKDRFNRQGGKVVYWTGADAGSTFMVEERDMTGAAELQALIDQVNAFVGAGVANGTTVGYITQASVKDVTVALTAANNELANPDRTAATVAAAQVALQAAVNGAQTIQPEEGKFYIVKSAMPNTDGRSNQKMYVNNTGAMQFNNQNAAALENVFQFVSDGAGKFYLKSVERGTFMNTAKGHGQGQETAVAQAQADAKTIAIANMGRENVVSLIPTGGAMMHAQAVGSQVVGWDNLENAGASAWIIEEVNIADFTHQVAVSAAGYSTLVLGYNAEIPTGVKAYTVSAANSSYMTMEEVEGVLPAGQAVVIEAEEGSYNFNYTAETPATVETNLLQGTMFNTLFTETGLVLAKPADEGETVFPVGFYKATMNKTVGETPAWQNNAFKAYLPGSVVSSNVNALRFNFGGETTAIDAVEVENANAPIYDLSGRRVLTTVKGGVYIQNGKKFIVK